MSYIMPITYIILCVLYFIMLRGERKKSAFLEKEIRRLVSERDVMMKYFLSDLYLKKVANEEYEDAAKINNLLKTLYPC